MTTDVTILPGVRATIDAGAVHVTGEQPLAVLGSALVGGGRRQSRHILNMHVDDVPPEARPEELLAAFAAARGVGEPFVGLMTAAATEHARVVSLSRGGVTVAAVVSVGLSNTCSAGVTPPAHVPRDVPPAPAAPGTINVILVIDAELEQSAMVNAVITATEAKTMTLLEWDVRTPQGEPASGTSTDSVVVACTGRGSRQAYAGPATVTGWLIARTVRDAITQICREKIARDGGRTGW